MKTLATFAIGLLLTACVPTEDSHKLSAEEIQQKYRVMFNGDAQTTTADVTFYAKHQAVILREGSKAYHNEQRLGSYPYSRTTKGFEPRHRFEYYGNGGRKHANVFEVVPIGWPKALATISLKENLRIAWEGFRVRPNETVSLELRQALPTPTPTGRVTEILTRILQDGESEFVVASSSLKVFRPGIVKAKLTRQQSGELQESTGAGGELYGEYSTPTVELKVQD